jgi:hypothetical protein
MRGGRREKGRADAALEDGQPRPLKISNNHLELCDDTINPERNRDHDTARRRGMNGERWPLNSWSVKRDRRATLKWTLLGKEERRLPISMHDSIERKGKRRISAVTWAVRSCKLPIAQN